MNNKKVMSKRRGKYRETGCRDERMKEDEGRQTEGWRQTEEGGQKDEQGHTKKGKDAGVGQVREGRMEGDREEIL